MICLANPISTKWTAGEQELLASFAEQIEMILELEQRKQEIKELGQFRARFLSDIGHEIRTPVSGIMSISHIIHDKALEAGHKDIAEYSEILIDCSNDLLKVINDIIDYSKLEKGKLQLELKRFDVINMINQSAKPFIAKFKNKEVKLSIEIDHNIPIYLYSAPSRISQILSNLISNALKFTETGAVKVSASLKEKGAEDMVLEFLVEDTGMGVSPEKQKLLFTPHQKQDSSDLRSSGPGLGLAISKGLVQLLGGEIWCESTPAKGSLFGFTIRAPLAHS